MKPKLLLNIARPLIFGALVFGLFQNCSNGGPPSTAELSSQSAASLLTVSPGAAQIDPFGKLTVSVTGGIPPYYFSVYPNFMGTADQSGNYVAPAQEGIATLTVTDSTGRTAAVRIQVGATTEPVPDPINAKIGAITSLTMQTPCPPGTQHRGVMLHGTPDTGPQFLHPPDQFCYANDPAATLVVTDVFVSEPANDNPPPCPTGYKTGERAIFNCQDSYLSGIYVYCTKWQFQNLCYKLDRIVNADKVYSSFYMTGYDRNDDSEKWTSAEKECDEGDDIVGTTTNCLTNVGGVAVCRAGVNQYFCAHRASIPR